MDSWINASRLRLFNTSRDEFYSKSNTAVRSIDDAYMQRNSGAPASTAAEADGRGAKEKATSVAVAGDVPNGPNSQQQHSGAAVNDTASSVCTPGLQPSLQQQQLQAPRSSRAENATAQLPLTGAQPSDANNESDAESLTDWFEIKDVITHRKRGNTFYYRVKWLDGSTTWLASDDVTEAAIDGYWAAKAQRSKRRRRRKQNQW